jgi:diguanylate cyclase (GGDEF)-like protein
VTGPKTVAATDAVSPTVPKGASRFIFGVSVLGALTAAASLLLISATPVPAMVVLSAVIIGLGELQFVHIRHGGENHSFNWSEAALVAGLVLLPAWWLPPVGAVAVAVAQWALKRDAVKVAFNALSFSVAAFAVTVVHQLVSDRVPTASALALACIVYFLWNTGAVAVVVALSKRLSVIEILRSGAPIGFLFTLANSSVAILIAIAAEREPLVLLAVPAILVQLLFAYRNTREVIGERDLWVAVQSISEDLQRAAASEVPSVALAAVTSVVGASTAELLVVKDATAERHRWERGALESAQGPLMGLVDDVWGRVSWDRSPFWLHRKSASQRQLRWLDDQQAGCALVVPLEWSSQLVGMLRVCFPGKVQATQRVETILSTLATHIASAITSNRQTEVLRHQAEHDDLTGLPNRTLLVHHLEQRLRGGAPGTLAVLFFDLDGFKVVNDSLGHHVGDQLLLEATRRLRSQMRPDDVIARFGGDEFIVVCDRIEHPQAALDVAQRLLDALLEPAPDGPHARPISASIGVACAEPGADPESLLRDADAAMYEAKRVGPGSARLFTSELRTQALDRLHLEADLRDALRREQLEVHYQPIVDLTTGRICELEALARWHHPERGAVSPAAFINVAEESGHIRALGEFVLHRACADMRRWLDLGIAGPGQRVAVNLSPLQLDAGLPTIVADALARHGLPPSALTLEVTESAFVDDPDAVASLVRLRRLGVRVALDDFGTGYSSLSALRDLPVDTVKIDRSFVSRLGEDRQLEALVRGIVSLAAALELQVIGEGVEDKTQSDLLASFGCDRAQGWLHGKPVSAVMTDAVLSASAGLRRPTDRVATPASVHPLHLA